HHVLLLDPGHVRQLFGRVPHPLVVRERPTLAAGGDPDPDRPDLQRPLALAREARGRLWAIGVRRAVRDAETVGVAGAGVAVARLRAARADAAGGDLGVDDGAAADDQRAERRHPERVTKNRSVLHQKLPFSIAPPP